MINTFTKLALVGALAAGMLGLARPARGALVIREITRHSHISTILLWEPDGRALGSRWVYMTDPGPLEGHFATNSIHSVTRTSASASHVSDFRTNADSFHWTFSGQSEVRHDATSPGDGISQVDAESAFTATLAFSSDTAFSYTLIPFRSGSLTNADASILFEQPDPSRAWPTNYIVVVAGIPPNLIGVWETNATMALSGVGPAGDYMLHFDLGSSVPDENFPAPARSGFVSLNGFEFRATTLPLPNTPPRLEASSAGGNVTLSWPMAYHAFDLEEAQAVDDAVWSPVAGTRTLVGDRLQVTVGRPGASRFFRLKGRL